MKKHLAFINLFLLFAAIGCANITDDLLTPYFAVRAALAADTVEGIGEKAEALVQAADGYLKSPDAAKDIKEEVGRVREGAAQMKGADLKDARESFKLVSDAMMHLVQKAPGEVIAVVYFCSMAPGYWLQENNSIGNPYYGKSMLKCGKKVKGEESKSKAKGHSHHGSGGGGC